jgi:hypothetical protein
MAAALICRWPNVRVEPSTAPLVFQPRVEWIAASHWPVRRCLLRLVWSLVVLRLQRPVQWIGLRDASHDLLQGWISEEFSGSRDELTLVIGWIGVVCLERLFRSY